MTNEWEYLSYSNPRKITLQRDTVLRDWWISFDDDAAFRQTSLDLTSPLRRPASLEGLRTKIKAIYPAAHLDVLAPITK